MLNREKTYRYALHFALGKTGQHGVGETKI